MKTEEWGDDWTIFPVDGYGSPDVLRSILRNEKPDVLWFMTDPRFWDWLWQMEDEVRPVVPMVYYHVWDNFPPPKYNKNLYDSTDIIVTISKLTDAITRAVTDQPDIIHHPHAVNTEVFKKIPADTVKEFRKGSFESGEKNPDRMIFFWNNRNARRKQSGTLVYWFKEFLDKVGHDNACLIMHTDPKDPHGQDLEHIIRDLKLSAGQVMISRQKIPAEGLAMLYNMADCTINISDAEGFGLATLESLACETPIIVNMTGGLQEQVTDGEEWFGIGIEPSSKSVIGSQNIPYIYEDRLSKDQFIQALEDLYNMSPEDRATLGSKGRQHVVSNYNFEDYQTGWDKIIKDTHSKYGSWQDRKGYETWRHEEL